MKRLMCVTPASCGSIKNLRITEYILLYFDKDNKLKRAIPDFEERIISFEDSLILEAMDSEKIWVFKILSETEEVTSPTFQIIANDEGEVASYSRCNDNMSNLESFLLNSERRKTTSKLLKKRR